MSEQAQVSLSEAKYNRRRRGQHEVREPVKPKPCHRPQGNRILPFLFVEHIFHADLVMWPPYE